MVKVAVMVKIIMGKALPMEFATHAATASLAHMAFGKTSTDATAAMRGESSAAKAAGMAATPYTTTAKAAAAVATAASHAAATTAAKAPAAASTPATATATATVGKRIASDSCACQCQRGNKSRNLMQTKRLLHRRSPFFLIQVFY